MTSQVKIRVLLAAHVLGALYLASNTRLMDSETSGFLLSALAGAQLALLAMWGALGSVAIVWRLLALAAAAACLRLLCGRYAPIEVAHPWITALSLAPIIAILGGMRYGRRLRVAQLGEESPPTEGLKSWLRRLPWTAAIAAIVLGIGLIVRARVSLDNYFHVVLSTAPPTFIAIELATLWAALGTVRPRLRLAVVLSAACLAGAVPGFYLGGDSTNDFVQLIMGSILAAIRAIITAASLLVVRSCGWRLVSGDSLLASRTNSM